MSKISVIVPVYNQTRHLAACLDSIWFQDYSEIEVIVVNDGSPDDFHEGVQKYRKHLTEDSASFANYYQEEGERLERTTLPRYAREGRTLVVVEHEQNKGLAAALNTGMRKATGEFVTYVPADDRCHPEMFSELASPLKADSADFSYADMFIVTEDNQIVREFQLPEYSFEACFKNWYLCGVCKLYRRSLHEAHGYYDEALLAHDHELFLRFAMNRARFIHVPKTLMSLLHHESEERAVDIHSPSNWNRLLEESKELVKKAREWST